MKTIEDFARELRAVYWKGLGDPERAAAEPSKPSLGAWMDVVNAAYTEFS